MRMITNAIPIAVQHSAIGPVVSKVIPEALSVVSILKSLIRTPTVGGYKRINVICIIGEAVHENPIFAGLLRIHAFIQKETFVILTEIVPEKNIQA
jgi:hypothetical protein